MTPFRARIREIAKQAVRSDMIASNYDGITDVIESTILRAIEELLAREPSEQMLVQGSVPHGITTNKVSAIWRRMAMQLWKEI